MDYMNPTAGLPDQNLPNNPFWGGVNQGLTEQTMIPFRENALSQQDLALQEARMKFQEASSPEARAMRAAETRSKTATFDATTKEAPTKAQYNVAFHNSMIARLPTEERAAIEKETQAYNESKGKPARALYDAFADLAPEIEKVPAQMRPGWYQTKIQQLQAQHPGIQIPQEYQQYSDQTLKDIQHGYYARVHSIAQQQKLDEQAAKDAAAMARQKQQDSSHATSAKEVANINAGATVNAARERANIEKPLNMSQQTAKWRSALAKDPNDIEAQEGMRSIVADSLSKDPVYSNLAAMYALKIAGNNKEAARNLKEQMDVVESQFMQRHGIGKSQSNKDSPVEYNGFRFPSQAALDAYKKAGGK